MAAKPEKEQAIALYKKGKTAKEIQQELGLKTGTLSTWLTAFRKENGAVESKPAPARKEQPKAVAKPAEKPISKPAPKPLPKPDIKAKPTPKAAPKPAAKPAPKQAPRIVGKPSISKEVVSLFTAGNTASKGYTATEFKTLGGCVYKYEYECLTDSFQIKASMFTSTGWKGVLNKFDVARHAVPEGESSIAGPSDFEKHASMQKHYFGEFDKLLKLLAL